MENNKIIMIKHSPIHIKFNNSFYLNQLSKGIDSKDVLFIDVTSRNLDKDFIKDLSPFYIGPVISSDGMVAKTFENFWQFSKVFIGKTIFRKKISTRKWEEKEFICSDDLGNPSQEWFQLRDFGFNESVPYRHPYQGKTLYHHYIQDGRVQKLSYIEARKKIYIPEYAKLVVNTKAFKISKQLVDEGKTIALVDFDAYNYQNTDYMKLRYERD